jgi:hypothetical protein
MSRTSGELSSRNENTKQFPCLTEFPHRFHLGQDLAWNDPPYIPSLSLSHDVVMYECLGMLRGTSGNGRSGKHESLELTYDQTQVSANLIPQLNTLTTAHSVAQVEESSLQSRISSC